MLFFLHRYPRDHGLSSPEALTMLNQIYKKVDSIGRQGRRHSRVQPNAQLDSTNLELRCFGPNAARSRISWTALDADTLFYLRLSMSGSSLSASQSCQSELVQAC